MLNNNKTKYSYKVAKDFMSIGIEMNCDSLENNKYITIKNNFLVAKNKKTNKKARIKLGGVIENALYKKECDEWYVTSSEQYIKKISKRKRRQLFNKYKDTELIKRKDIFGGI